MNFLLIALLPDKLAYKHIINIFKNICIQSHSEPVRTLFNEFFTIFNKLRNNFQFSKLVSSKERCYCLYSITTHILNHNRVWTLHQTIEMRPLEEKIVLNKLEESSFFLMNNTFDSILK